MRKFFTLFTLIAALFCLTACDLDKVMTYTFFYRIEGSVEDEADQAALIEYFESTFLTETMVYTYTCKSAEAMEKALNQMGIDMQLADDDFIYSCLNYEEDSVDLIGWLSSDKTSNWVGIRTWSYSQRFSE